MASIEAQVAQVWRRLGFGPTQADIANGVAVGPNALIEELLNRPLTIQANWNFPTNTDYTINDKFVSRMIELMAYGANPLQERVAWILHGLLVIALDGTVYFPDMRQHVYFMRSNVYSNYSSILEQVSTMPGMLKYLSGHQNVKGHPNENYARELCELFTLGRTHPFTGEQNYTETDVKEIARSLTGWQYNWNNGTTFFSQSHWDDGMKEFLNYKPSRAKLPEVLRAIKAHPSWSYFVPHRFYKELVGLEPTWRVLKNLNDAFGIEGNLQNLIRAIATSEEFLSDEAINARAKSPVELVASTAKLLNRTTLNYSLDWLLRDYFGHNPLNAPNVSGWHKGSEWYNTSVYMAWSSLCTSMVWSGISWDGTGTYAPIIQQLHQQSNPNTAAQKALNLACIFNPKQQTFIALDTYAKAGTWDMKRAAGLMNLLFMSPDYFVN